MASTTRAISASALPSTLVKSCVRSHARANAPGRAVRAALARSTPLQFARSNAVRGATVSARRSVKHTSRALTLCVEASETVPAGSVSLVLLAGGVGKRMGASIPKQYLPLRGSPIATYSLLTCSKMEVCFNNGMTNIWTLHFPQLYVSSVL